MPATPVPSGRQLLEQVAALVAIPSESHSESALADHVADRLRDVPWLEVERIGDNVVARTTGAGTRVILAGHLDTVPAAGNARPTFDGDVLWGLGSADMKAGLAVMLELATSTRPDLQVTWVFYTCEEVAREHSGLLAIDAVRPDLLRADAAILGEPTGAVVEAGCQGVVKIDVVLRGRRAHTARPWMGVNAIHRLGPLLDRVAAAGPREPVVGGCRYREALQALAVSGGVAGNVVPDEARVRLNHRFAPDRSVGSALESVRRLLDPVMDASLGDELSIVDSAPSARPALDHPLLAALVAASGCAPRAKLGWTDVAFFAERGVPAANFGPGDPEVAHTREERVTAADVLAVLETLRSVVGPTADVAD